MTKYLAKINNNIVENVLLFEDSDYAQGIDYCKNMIGDPQGTYVECSSGVNSYNYNSASNIFYPQKPHNSWVLNANFEWEAPVTKPDKGSNTLITWNESNLRWEACSSQDIQSIDKYWDQNTSSWVDI